MSDRKIRIRRLPDGRWAAGADGWLDAVVATAEMCGSTATALAHGAPMTATVCVETTPWEASAAVCAVLGEDLPVAWETLPWPVLREAHGVVAGVTHVLGASLEAKRAVDAVRRELAGVDGECVACGDESKCRVNSEESDALKPVSDYVFKAFQAEFARLFGAR